MFRIALIALALGASLAGAVQAQQWPVRSVRLIVPSSPGGGTDTVGRLLGHGFTSAFGQQFVVDNRPGAAGLIGYRLAARATGDGYTLLVAPTTITSLPLVVKNPQYDPIRDFVPITQVVASTQAIVVHPEVPAKDLKALVALAKQKPLTYASPGHGSVPHLAMEWVKLISGMPMTQVPYKGVGPGLRDVIAGRVSAMLVNVISAKPHIDAGRLRPLAVTSRKRDETLPSVPAVSEAGYGEYEALQWFGLFTIAGTPQPIVQRLNEAAVATLREPETRKRLAGQEPVGNSREEFARIVKAEVAKWRKVVQAASITAR